MRTLRTGLTSLAIALGMALVAAACASGEPVVPDEASQDTSPTATAVADPTPTPLVIPTTAPTVTATPAPTTAPTATVEPTATVAAPTPTATTVPPSPTATSAPAVPRPTTIPKPAPTSTPVPVTPSPTPTAWVNPDCYVGPGAADEPVWWCGGRICVVNAPHAGCPKTPPIPTVQIGCTISPRRPVLVNESLTFTAFQKPERVLVSYVFDHGDGTLDRTSQSHAYYAAPGSYDVILRWDHSGGKGTTFCGTVTVIDGDPVFDVSHYVGRSPEAATAIAVAKGFVVRISRIDDQVFPGTTDYRRDRVNFEIDANIVTSATVG